MPQEIKTWAHDGVLFSLRFLGLELVVAIGLFGLYVLLVMWVSRAALRFDKAYREGMEPNPGEATRLARRARFLRQSYLSAALELRSLELLGDMDRAVQVASATSLARQPAWLTCQVQVAFLRAGRYGQSLALEVGPRPRDARHPSFPASLALIELNRVAAEMDMGSWSLAEARLLAMRGEVEAIPGVRTIRLLHLAHLLAHRGDGEAALATLGRADRLDLPVILRPAHDFTSAAALLPLALWDRAEESVRTGLESARLQHQRRDGLVLLSRIALGRGSLEEAERCARGAAENPWRWGGGDGLLLWGDILSRLGRHDDARTAWSLAVERDAESESARYAIGRS